MDGLSVAVSIVGLLPAEGQPWCVGDEFKGREVKGDLPCRTVSHKSNDVKYLHVTSVKSWV